MKKLFGLLLLISNFATGQEVLCVKDSFINSNTRFQYVFEDSSVVIIGKIKGLEFVSPSFYYDVNECSFVPKFIAKANDSSFLFIHGKGQHYRVVTVLYKDTSTVKMKSFENEIFESSSFCKECYFFVFQNMPLMIKASNNNYEILKYSRNIKFDIDEIRSFDLYSNKLKIRSSSDGKKIKSLLYKNFNKVIL